MVRWYGLKIGATQMALTPNGPAPYAPPGSVISVVAHHRDRGLPTPVTTGVIARVLESGEGLASRVMTALRLLDLVDKEGAIQPAFDEMARAASPEDFRARFADVVRSAYADVLNYIDPATVNIGRIEGQFRNYTPRGQVGRQAALFRGLCVFTGIIAGTSEQDAQPAPSRTKASKPSPPAKTKRVDKNSVSEAKPPPPPVESDAKSRYIELLLKQANENPTDDLFNRIEKVLGIGPTSSAPASGQDNDE
jgi:hypothetical protein